MTHTPTPLVLDALEALRQLLGAATVLIGADVPERNCNDWSTQPPSPPIAVVRPVDAAGVSAALKACRAVGVPVGPRAGSPACAAVPAQSPAGWHCRWSA
jgi:hypothetical protein